MFSDYFKRRILLFHIAALPAYVAIVSLRRASGHPISQFDAQIAVVARQNKTKLATRNVDDFKNCGVSVVHPWSMFIA